MRRDNELPRAIVHALTPEAWQRLPSKRCGFLAKGLERACILISLGIQACKSYLHWGPKYINLTYFGLFESPGSSQLGVRSAIGDASLLETNLGDNHMACRCFGRQSPGLCFDPEFQTSGILGMQVHESSQQIARGSFSGSRSRASDI